MRRFRLLSLVLCAGIPLLCIDQPDDFPTDLGVVRTTPIYHASFLIEGAGKVIQVDPSSQANYKGLPKADLILITNGGPEHFDPAAIAKLSRKQTSAIAPADVAAKLPRCTAMANGETVGFGDITIQAVAAYHDANDKGKGNGYILTYPGLRIYISGDTGVVPEMKSIKNINVGFLSVGTPDTMTLADAAEAIRIIKPKTLYPNHYRKTEVDTIRKELATPGTEIRMRYWY